MAVDKQILSAASFVSPKVLLTNVRISVYPVLIDIAVNEEIVEKSGAWFSYKGTRLGQGRENSKLFLKDNPELALEIENLIREKYNMPLTKNSVRDESKDEV